MPPRYHKKWSLSEAELGTQMWLAGKTTSQIAVAVTRLGFAHRTRNAVIGWAHRKKLVPHPQAGGNHGGGKVRRAPQKPAHAFPVLEAPALTPEPANAPAGPLEAAPDPLRIEPGQLTLMQLNGTTCRWPFGDAAPFTFCGCTTVGASSYCEEHQDRSRQVSYAEYIRRQKSGMATS